MAFFIKGSQRKLLDLSLGFAGGVMVAASFWSLLAPAIEMAQKSGLYGEDGEYAFAPVSAGFLLGALFVYGTDVLMTYAGVNSPFDLDKTNKKEKIEDDSNSTLSTNSSYYDKADVAVASTTITFHHDICHDGPLEEVVRHRKNKTLSRGRRDKRGEVDAHQGLASSGGGQPGDDPEEAEDCKAAAEADEDEAIKEMLRTEHNDRWKRILLLIVAVTVHNIPEGLAVGVAFGSIGQASTATFESARNLAIGIGIQNFPEGLAVSLPLKTAGFSVWKSIWYGQLSGMVEPVSGVLGALLVSFITPLLPYALAFAAGAMIYVVIDDIIPEAQTCGNGKLASWGAIIGFLIMMSLDLL